MAEYISKYTGAEIDEGIANGNEANSHFPMYEHNIRLYNDGTDGCYFDLSFKIISTSAERFTDYQSIFDYAKISEYSTSNFMASGTYIQFPTETIDLNSPIVTIVNDVYFWRSSHSDVIGCTIHGVQITFSSVSVGTMGKALKISSIHAGYDSSFSTVYSFSDSVVQIN